MAAGEASVVSTAVTDSGEAGTDGSSAIGLATGVPSSSAIDIGSVEQATKVLKAERREQNDAAGTGVIDPGQGEGFAGARPGIGAGVDIVVDDGRGRAVGAGKKSILVGEGDLVAIDGPDSR